MKKAEIKAGGIYVAKVSGKLTSVRVDAINESSFSSRTIYAVMNLKTGRKITFRSAMRFRAPATIGSPASVGCVDPQSGTPDTGFNNRHED